MRVLQRVVAGAVVLVTALAVAVPASGHPYHTSIVELTPGDGVVGLVVKVPVEAFQEGTGVIVGSDPAPSTASITRAVLASLAISSVDHGGWLVEVVGVSTRMSVGTEVLDVELVAHPPSGVVPDLVTLTYSLVVDRVPEHRVIVAADGEAVAPIDKDNRTVDVPMGTYSLDPNSDSVAASARLDLEAAGVPGAIGDAVLGAGGAAVWVAVIAAFGLGMAHAFAPGHGKTLTAAYLVGSRGTKRHAVLLGLTTATSHTVGVAVLGILTLVAAESFDSAAVYTVLGVTSGLAITGIGATLLWRFVWRRPGSDVHGHSHGSSGHARSDHGHASGSAATLRWGSLAGLGLAGGMVPSASAVVLLLVALRFGRPELGLLLVGLFGLGMSAVLVGSGLVVLAADGAVRDVAARRWGFASLARVSTVAAPFAAAVVTIVGLVWTAQAVW